MHVTLRKNMLISLFISEGLGHQWQVKVSTKLIVIKTNSSFQSASELSTSNLKFNLAVQFI